MSVEKIKKKLESFPRFPLIATPTPFMPLENLSKDLGVRLFMKRDDLASLAVGGNKARKLEFLLGEALAEGADTVFTAGWYHSNHALLTAAAAGKAGLDAILFLKGKDPHYKGSLFLDALTGAEVRIFDVSDSSLLSSYMEEAASVFRTQGKKPYIIPVGGSNSVGSLGYVAGAIELAEQLRVWDMIPDYVVIPTSSGGTHAGVLCGLREALPETKVLGIGVGDDPEELQKKVFDISQDLSRILDLSPWDEKNLKESFCFDYGFGPYGTLDASVMKFIRKIGSREGLFLDPVYTAKAFYGLVDLVEKKIIPQGAKIVFIHTGGLSSLFQYEEEVMEMLE